MEQIYRLDGTAIKYGMEEEQSEHLYHHTL